MNTEEIIREKLEKVDLYPKFITYTTEYAGGLLGLTFFNGQDYRDFLEMIGYKSQCDKSGYVLNEKKNTVILMGMALGKIVLGWDQT